MRELGWLYWRHEHFLKRDTQRFVIFFVFGNHINQSHAFFCTQTHTHTCGSMERWMGGVRAGCMPPLLKDSERGGREGSEMRLDNLCCSAGELCLFSLDRSSTWDRSHTTVTHSPTRRTTNHHICTNYELLPPEAPLQATRQPKHHSTLWDNSV